MKFLKISIVILFILSLSSAATSLYLSNVRENEKEKRIYLEGVKAELEGQVERLETENVQLSEKVSQLEAEKQQLGEQLLQEKDARQEALTLISQKDADLETIRGEAQQAQFAFKDAQKRNEELERILDELEARMRQIEGQGQLPGSEVGYLEIKPVAPAAPDATEPAKPAETTPALAEEKKEQVVEGKKEETPEVEFKPLTNLPEPPKKRKFFSFFRSSDKKEEKAPVSEVTSAANQTPLPVEAPSSPVQQPQQEPVQVKTETVKEPIQKTDQSIAAGSVLLVNRKYNFVVVNLGSRQNLNLNDVISIQQEGNEIAKARVEKVYDDYSAAYIIEEQSDRPIAEGNAVARA